MTIEDRICDFLHHRVITDEMEVGKSYYYFSYDELRLLMQAELEMAAKVADPCGGETGTLVYKTPKLIAQEIRALK